MQQAAQLAPNERDVRYWLANAYRMNGSTGRALEIFGELLAARPDDFEVSFAKAFLLREAGRPGEAAEALLSASRQPGVSTHQLLQLTGFLRAKQAVALDGEVGPRGGRVRALPVWSAEKAADKVLALCQETFSA